MGNTITTPPPHHPESSSVGWYDNHRPIPPNPWDIERRVSLLEQSTRDVKEELGKINGNLSKILWIVLTAIVIAVLNMVLTGKVVP